MAATYQPTIAAREGGSSPEGNPTLADAIQQAKDN
jgi:transcriptional/translational regulatory protein YebC/TACO1